MLFLLSKQQIFVVDRQMEEHCRALKLLAAEMLACRKRGGPPEELQQLHMKSLLILSLMKSSYRTLCEETEQVGSAS